VEVRYPGTGRSVRYETYHPNQEPPYSRDAMARMQSAVKAEEDEEEEMETDGSSEGPFEEEHSATPMESRHDMEISIDDDEVWEDTVTHVSSGVVDILLTGSVNLSFSTFAALQS
jgi:hypothetical protein